MSHFLGGWLTCPYRPVTCKHEDTGDAYLLKVFLTSASRCGRLLIALLIPQIWTSCSEIISLAKHSHIEAPMLACWCTKQAHYHLLDHTYMYAMLQCADRKGAADLLRDMTFGWWHLVYWKVMWFIDEGSCEPQIRVEQASAWCLAHNDSYAWRISWWGLSSITVCIYPHHLVVSHFLVTAVCMLVCICVYELKSIPVTIECQIQFVCVGSVSVRSNSFGCFCCLNLLSIAIPLT